MIENSGLSAANGSGRGPAPCAAAVMPPVQAGMLPSALPARSAPIGVRVVPSLAASSGATAACAGERSAQASAPRRDRSGGLTAQPPECWSRRGFWHARWAASRQSAPRNFGPTVTLSVQLDTTVQFTGLRRLTPPQSRLLANPNADDGDRGLCLRRRLQPDRRVFRT